MVSAEYWYQPCVPSAQLVQFVTLDKRDECVLLLILAFFTGFSQDSRGNVCSFVRFLAVLVMFVVLKLDLFPVTSSNHWLVVLAAMVATVFVAALSFFSDLCIEGAVSGVLSLRKRFPRTRLRPDPIAAYS